MKSSFPLFQSHLDLAHDYWSQLVCVGDHVIDATCGNGHDTLKLCQLAIANGRGKVYAFDIQSQAIEATRHLLKTHLQEEEMGSVDIRQGCHSTFPLDILPESIKLIVYNLGYLPGGNKQYTTRQENTLHSLRHAQQLLLPGGVISMTCYPGHSEGASEQAALLAEAAQLSPKEWSCCHHVWLNRREAPSLLLIQKKT
jgi:predicted methyltransferase